MENLEFLTDVVPKTTTYKQHKQKQAKDSSANGLAHGQTTLDGVEQATDGADQDHPMEDVVGAEAKNGPVAPNGEQLLVRVAAGDGAVQ